MTPERQPYSSFSALNVTANQEANFKLSGGRTIAYEYQLGVRSTVPFVRLIGGDSSQKTIGFNEKIVVPPGQMVTVKNASWHPGDIWINSGWDPSAIPVRITVPVQLNDLGGGLYGPANPVDTRRVRRAYVAGFPDTPPLVTLATGYTRIGFARERSHAINQALSDELVATARYVETIALPPTTSPGLLPLGYRATAQDSIHALLDQATFAYSSPDGVPETSSGAIYFVLEYT